MMISLTSFNSFKIGHIWEEKSFNLLLSVRLLNYLFIYYNYTGAIRNLSVMDH